MAHLWAEQDVRTTGETTHFASKNNRKGSAEKLLPRSRGQAAPCRVELGSVGASSSGSPEALSSLGVALPPAIVRSKSDVRSGSVVLLAVLI